MTGQANIEVETTSSCAHCASLQKINEELTDQLREMEQRAYHDVLTGLPNRRYFVEELENSISRAERYGNVAALLFLDVNRLKVTNDTYGHGAGDAVLTRLARLLASKIRKSDMVARIGGDEFAMLLENLDAEEVEAKITALLDKIESTTVEYKGETIALSAAIGHCFVGPKDSVASLMASADEAMYKQKQAIA